MTLEYCQNAIRNLCELFPGLVSSIGSLQTAHSLLAKNKSLSVPSEAKVTTSSSGFSSKLTQQTAITFLEEVKVDLEKNILPVISKLHSPGTGAINETQFKALLLKINRFLGKIDKITAASSFLSQQTLKENADDTARSTFDYFLKYLIQCLQQTIQIQQQAKLLKQHRPENFFSENKPMRHQNHAGQTQSSSVKEKGNVPNQRVKKTEKEMSQEKSNMKPTPKPIQAVSGTEAYQKNFQKKLLDLSNQIIGLDEKLGKMQEIFDTASELDKKGEQGKVLSCKSRHLI